MTREKGACIVPYGRLQTVGSSILNTNSGAKSEPSSAAVDPVKNPALVIPTGTPMKTFGVIRLTWSNRRIKDRLNNKTKSGKKLILHWIENTQLDQCHYSLHDQGDLSRQC